MLSGVAALMFGMFCSSSLNLNEEKKENSPHFQKDSEGSKSVDKITSLFSFDESVSESGGFYFGEHCVGICFDGVSSNLNTINGFRCSRSWLGSSASGCREQLPNLCTEGIHTFTVLGKPMHHITMDAGNAEGSSLAVADDILLGESVLLAEIST